MRSADLIKDKHFIQHISKMKEPDRNTTKPETPTTPTLKNGTAGMAFICQQLYQLTGNPKYKQEAEYWATQTLLFEDTDSGFAGFDLKDETKAFGLLEGIAGIGMIMDTII